MTRTARWLVLTMAVLTVVLAEPASAAVTVTRAEVSGSGLRIEGTALASRNITVDGIVMGTSDSAGSFRIQRDPFTRPADCTVSPPMRGRPRPAARVGPFEWASSTGMAGMLDDEGPMTSRS